MVDRSTNRKSGAIFRALVYGACLGISNITKLVARLSSSPALATIAGFDSDDIPWVGTFYDFRHRLWGEDKRHLVERKRRTRSPKNKDQAPFVDGPVSKPNKHLSETLAEAVMGYSFSLDLDSIILAQIFERCALTESEEMGLVSSPDNFNQRTFHPEKTLPGPVNITPGGIPMCPAGCPMRYYGPDLVRTRLKWRCPIIYGSKTDRARVSCQTPCSSSPFGRVVHTKPIWALRVHSYPPRSSPRWEKTYALRYQSEQMNNLLENGYNIQNLRAKDRCRAVWGQTLTNIGIHLAAQAARPSPRVLQTLAKQAL